MGQWFDGLEVKVKSGDYKNKIGKIIGLVESSKEAVVEIAKGGDVRKIKFDNIEVKEKLKSAMMGPAQSRIKNAAQLLKEVDFIDRNSVLPFVLTAIDKNLILGMRGKTGTGKTWLIAELARVYKKELVTLNMNCNTTADEIKGKFALNEEGKLSWLKSSVINAMENGHWLCIEEANFMSEEMASVFYSLLDWRKNLTIDEHTGETINSHQDFRVFLTMNPNYEGTTRMNDAIQNRINIWLDMDYLKPGQEKRLLMKRYTIDKDKAAILTNIADKIRKDDSYRDLSTRTLENCAKLIEEGFDFKEAIEVTIVNTLTDDEVEKKKIRGVIELFYDGSSYMTFKEYYDEQKEAEEEENKA